MGYGDLDSMIGKLKRAAIDAYMADDGFSPDISAGDIWYSKWGWAPNSYRRPGEDGEGGGEVSSPNPWADDISFDSIRSRVDDAVSKWKGLPDGSGADSYKTSTSTAAASLGASGSGASIADDGAIFTSSQTLGDLLTQNLVAAFIEPMLDKYYTQFKSVAQSLGAATAILEMNYTAQAGMWKSVREDVVTVVDSAESAFSSYAESEAAASLKVTLGVVVTVAGAVVSIATASAAVGLVAAMISISGAASTAISAIDADASIEGGSYGEIMESFEASLEKLRSTISDQETELNKMMTGAVTAIQGDWGGFDLDKYNIKARDPKFSDEIVMNRQHTNTVSTNMTRVIEGLGAAKTSLGTAPGTDPTPHDSRISSGTHSNASNLFDYTSNALKSTKQEYELGKQLFDAEVDAFFNSEAANQQTVEQLRASEALTDDN